MVGFKEFIKQNKNLNEQAFLIPSDYLDNLKNKLIDTDTSRFIDDKTLICKFGDLDAHWVDSLNDVCFIMCLDDKNIVRMYVRLKRYNLKIKNKKTFIIQTIEKSKSYNKRGEGRKLYDWLLDSFVIISDSKNTPASQKIWIELSKRVNVSLFNIERGVIIKQNINAEKLKDNIWYDYELYDYLDAKTIKNIESLRLVAIK